MLDTIRLFSEVIAAAALAGASCALVGFYLTNMRLSFMGVCLSHAALAGALVAQLTGLPAWPVVFLAATGTGLLVGPLADAARVEAGTSLGILFSLMMGVVFLLVGLMPGPKSEALGLIWGSVLLVRAVDLWAMSFLLAAQVAFILLLDKELRAILFSRDLAALVGIRERVVLYLLLVAAAAVVTVHLDIVGGLMLYGLLVTPAAAAKLLARTYVGCLLWSIGVGIAGSLGGLVLSYIFALPAGASIVVMLGALFTAAAFYDRIRRRRPCPAP